MDSALFTRPEVSAEREEYYRRLHSKGAVPLWDVLADLIPHAPRPAAVPALWRYEEMRPLLLEAGGVITPEEAERRVLALENPGLPGSCLIARSIYAGLQLILPGEVAPTHRHTMSALRFVLEGEGGYTAVDGERTIMHPGDFILTPSWTYHDHGAVDEPVVWLDGLDIGLVNLFDASFAEPYPDNTPGGTDSERLQPVSRPVGDALARYGHNLMPVDYTPQHRGAPVFNYPYSRSREVLDQLYRNGPVDPKHGIKMQYVNPATGGYPMPTIAAFLQLLPAGFDGKPYRSTDATVFCVAEGQGSTTAGSETLTWGPRDVFTVPSWMPITHRASSEAVVFSFSDRAAQKALGVWREDTSL
jgi:gentisate 1,2-dioxygenase